MSGLSAPEPGDLLNASGTADLTGLTYWVRTFGCQMNLHEAERVAGVLEAEGLLPVATPEEADVCVFMSCCVRERADTHLAGQVSAMASAPPPPSGRRIVALGGCIAQRDAGRAREQMPRLDAVFGTQAIARLPRLLRESLDAPRGHLAVDVAEPYEGFSADLPQRRDDAWRAWVPIMYGCDNFCSYCVVPYVRGRERSRPAEAVLDECGRLVADGVREICLLGQNVNSYGKGLDGAPSFAELLREVARTGVDRVRFTSSHPKDLTRETLEAMAFEPAVMPHLHLAAQSGSDRILKAMNRHYTADDYLALADLAHATVPGLALTTDLIVGFPGETEEDFQATLDLVERAELAGAFTFIYSKRAGTKAAEMADQVPREVSGERLERLAELVRERSASAIEAMRGTVQEVLCEGPSKRDPGMLSGHSPQNHTVHFPVPDGRAAEDLTGMLVDVGIVETRSYYALGEMVGEAR